MADNLAKIDEEDAAIKALERKLGFRTDAKRKARNNEQTDKEGFGIGFTSFLDSIDQKVKQGLNQYKPPSDDYDFNKDEFEVAPSEGELEAGFRKNDPNDSDQQDFSSFEGNITDYDEEDDEEEGEEENSDQEKLSDNKNSDNMVSIEEEKAPKLVKGTKKDLNPLEADYGSEQ